MAYTLTTTLIAAGTPSQFTDPTVKSAIIEKMATTLSVPPAAVQLSITAASVRLAFTISVESAAAADAAVATLSTSFATAASAGAFLSTAALTIAVISIESAPTSNNQVPNPPPVTSPSPPVASPSLASGGEGGGGGGGAIIGAGGGGGAVVLLLLIFLYSRSKRKSKTQGRAKIGARGANHKPALPVISSDLNEALKAANLSQLEAPIAALGIEGLDELKGFSLAELESLLANDAHHDLKALQRTKLTALLSSPSRPEPDRTSIPRSTTGPEWPSNEAALRPHSSYAAPEAVQVDIGAARTSGPSAAPSLRLPQVDGEEPHQSPDDISGRSLLDDLSNGLLGAFSPAASAGDCNASDDGRTTGDRHTTLECEV